MPNGKLLRLMKRQVNYVLHKVQWDSVGMAAKMEFRTACWQDAHNIKMKLSWQIAMMNLSMLVSLTLVD